MLGKDFYKTEVNGELSNERLRSLVFFYEPLIGSKALALYEYFALKGSDIGFQRLNDLLNSLNQSVDVFEKNIGKLNEYRLLKTLKKDDHYIFVVSNPLTMKEFIHDDIFVRDFILKASGTRYQELLSEIVEEGRYPGFEDVSVKMPPGSLEEWNNDDETFLKQNNRNEEYSSDTLFDVNVFLKDISTNLLPLRFRSRDNMAYLARMADLYNISYDRMRTFLPQIARSDAEEFDLKKLRYLCMKEKSDYQRIPDDKYDVPCVQYLMNLQDGKEVSEYDKKIILNLAEKYHLTVPVINVLLAYGLKNCDNRLIEKYLYGIASDLHRNDVQTSKQALERLNNPTGKNRRQGNELPVYDTSRNKEMSKEQEEELLKLMGKI